jgi:UDPglucose 6-dehydrogenase
VRALERTSLENGYTPELLHAVEAVNFRQKQVLFEKISTHFSSDLKGRSFALWGLAFKPNTDDMREASSRALMEALWEHGASVQAFDPEAQEETRRIYGERTDLQLCDTPEQALENADALIVITEWNMFRSPDFDMIRKRLKSPVIFDGRNLYDPGILAEQGFSYHSIGRETLPPTTT